jgi:hypothetical protein
MALHESILAGSTPLTQNQLVVLAYANGTQAVYKVTSNTTAAALTGSLPGNPAIMNADIPGRSTGNYLGPTPASRQDIFE